MKKIMIFNAHYLPGFMSGGIARTIMNTAEWLGDNFDFHVVTKDRDLGDVAPYKNIKPGSWNRVGKSKVRYLSPSELGIFTLRKIINDENLDYLHLNSYYDLFFTFKILFLHRIGLLNVKKIIMSPRGEFVEGPLKIKYLKKITFISITKILGMHRNLFWHASLKLEAEGIAKVIGVPLEDVKIAIDLPIHQNLVPKITKSKSNKILKVFFFSRITREKNLDGALKILSKVKTKLEFHIIGPKEDPIYWDECNTLIKKLPKNIIISDRGTIESNKIFNTLAEYDLLFFPSHGENFAHVVAETIAVGTKVLITELPAWPNLQSDGVGWNVPIDNIEGFIKIIEDLSRQPPEERSKDRAKVINAANIRLFNKEGLEENINLYS